MLIQHIAQNDRIFIQVDSDCDGYTSAAFLINYLNYLFPNYVSTNITYRLQKGKEHGLILETIPNDVQLVIAPDASSNDYYEHDILKRAGIDVLVLDHHEADRVSPAACVINNQLCDYPNKTLSGVGVVYKFCSYIDSLLEVDYTSRLLDLVALGLIADMMRLTEYETRHLITQGLLDIQNPFFKEMVRRQEFSLRDGITPIGVAFYIAPYVNAAVRMGTDKEKLLLFESMLNTKGNSLIPSTKRGCRGQMETVAEQAARNCNNIKNHQTKARDAGLAALEELIESEGLLDKHQILAIKLENLPIEKNLTGLIANQLMSQYQRPVLLLNKVEHEDGSITWEGSGRNCAYTQLTDLRGFLQNTGLVMYAEGHSAAFGVGIEDNKFKEFIEYTDKALKDIDFTSCYNVDFIYQDSDFKSEDIIEIAKLKPYWGQGFEEPYIALTGVNVYKDNITLMSKDKNPTIKITLPNGTSLIKFKSSVEEYNSLCSEYGYVSLNIVGKCEMNVWNGNISAQVIIEDYEITKTQEYFF